MTFAVTKFPKLLRVKRITNWSLSEYISSRSNYISLMSFVMRRKCIDFLAVTLAGPTLHKPVLDQPSCTSPQELTIYERSLNSQMNSTHLILCQDSNLQPDLLQRIQFYTFVWYGFVILFFLLTDPFCSVLCKKIKEQSLQHLFWRYVKIVTWQMIINRQKIDIVFLTFLFKD